MESEGITSSSSSGKHTINCVDKWMSLWFPFNVSNCQDTVYNCLKNLLFCDLFHHLLSYSPFIVADVRDKPVPAEWVGITGAWAATDWPAGSTSWEEAQENHGVAWRWVAVYPGLFTILLVGANFGTIPLSLSGCVTAVTNNWLMIKSSTSHFPLH